MKFENETVIGVLSDKLKPNCLVGSYVIIPKSLVSTPFELTDKEWRDTKEMMHQIKAYLDQQHAPDGYNIGWNVGKVAGQTEPHAHLHIIPRFADEPLAGFGIRYWIKQEDNIRTSLRKDKP